LTRGVKIRRPARTTPSTRAWLHARQRLARSPAVASYGASNIVGVTVDQDDRVGQETNFPLVFDET
jgi:hypothetical protein